MSASEIPMNRRDLREKKGAEIRILQGFVHNLPGVNLAVPKLGSNGLSARIYESKEKGLFDWGSQEVCLCKAGNRRKWRRMV